MINTKEHNKDLISFTPKYVTDSHYTFAIPIYQRLFEWNKKTIYTLLDNILVSMRKNDKEDYYIGMLTSTKVNNNVFKLVDGQQRFTVMVLMAITFMHRNIESDKWKNFLLFKGQPRLNFESRGSDIKFLETITSNKDFYNKVLESANNQSQEVSQELSCVNKKMAAGLQYINSYLCSINEQLKRLDYYTKSKSDFCYKMSAYIFAHLKFFITQLPDYEAKDLNLYFERMNSSGKNLENYEILKVKMLERIYKDHKNSYKYYVKAWDIVADMDKRVFIRRSGRKKENAGAFRNRCLAAIDIVRGPKPIKVMFKNGDNKCVINAALDNDNNNVDSEEIDQCKILSIKKIIRRQLEDKAPCEDDHRDVPFISLLTFPRFLLQVLYYYSCYNISDEDCNRYGVKSVHNTDVFKVNEFFNESNMLSTFDTYLPENKYQDFVDILFALRVLYDFYVIRIKNSDDSYTLLMSRGLSDDSGNEDEGDDDCQTDFAKLRAFESMLYVNSVNVTYYRWLPALLHRVYNADWFNRRNNQDLVNPTDLLTELKSIDNNIHKGDDLKKFSYRDIDRYWFWRLDYYFWEEVIEARNESKEYSSTRNYRFRRNRSIEHLHPQNQENNIEWTDKQVNCFYNLAMISQGFNSTQSNDSVRVKFARIADAKTDLESLKMFDMYIRANRRYDQWDIKTANEHGNRMMDILIDSFKSNKNDEENYSFIRTRLKEIRDDNNELMTEPKDNI